MKNKKKVILFFTVGKKDWSPILSEAGLREIVVLCPIRTIDAAKNKLYELIEKLEPEAVILSGSLRAKDFVNWYDELRDAMGLEDLDRRNIFSIEKKTDLSSVKHLEQISDIKEHIKIAA